MLGSGWFLKDKNDDSPNEEPHQEQTLNLLVLTHGQTKRVFLTLPCFEQ